MAWPHDRETLWRRRNVERPKRIWQPGYGRNRGSETGSTAGYDRLMPSGANVDFSRLVTPRKPRLPTEYKKRLCGNFVREEGRVLRFNDRPVRGDREASPPEQYVEGAFEEYKDRRLQLPTHLNPYIIQRIECSSSVESQEIFGNLMDWSSTNLLGITMLMKMYLWNGNITDNEVRHGVGRYEVLINNNNLSGDPIKNCMISFAWNPEGKYGAIGMISGEIHIWDSEVRRMNPNGTKIASLCERNEEFFIWDISSTLTFNPNPPRREDDDDDPSKSFNCS